MSDDIVECLHDAEDMLGRAAHVLRRVETYLGTNMHALRERTDLVADVRSTLAALDGFCRCDCDDINEPDDWCGCPCHVCPHDPDGAFAVNFSYGSHQRQAGAERFIAERYRYRDVAADFWGTRVSWTTENGASRCQGSFSDNGILIISYCQAIAQDPPR